MPVNTESVTESPVEADRGTLGVLRLPRTVLSAPVSGTSSPTRWPASAARR